MLHASSLHGASLTSESLSHRAPQAIDARVDMTAMIDLVFMLNIYFLVTSLVNVLAEIDLPAAKHVVAADLDRSIILTVIAVADGSSAQIYLGEGKAARLIPQGDEEASIAEAVEAGKIAGKNSVVIKAERRVPLREISRVANAAAAEEITLNLAVMEKDQ
jgi:biopolymer transport protein ExbD